MERNLITGIAFSVFAFMAFFLFKKVSGEEKGILTFKGRSAFSTNSFFDSRLQPGLVLDGDVNTAWIEGMPGGGTCMGSGPRGVGAPGQQNAAPAPDERPECLFVQIDLGFSHRPGGNGPEKNPLASLKIINAMDQARPQRVRLVFFKQEVVDIDREFRLPTLPEHWITREVVLADGIENTIGLDFLPPPEDSPRYPGKVKRIWLRLEVLSAYPGKSGNVGISEISYKNHDGVVP
ncbi:MAG: hypothetical protein JNM27_12700 [Leptospirales bacterium]|nr:hypothetical protein [Leptospirales bacterium]